MAVLEILSYPDERLRRMAEPVEIFDDELRSFINDLEETMGTGPGAVGIAAPQVGHLQRIFIVDISSKPKHKNSGRMILVNPEITEWSGMAVGREGCLSVPDYTGNVIRASKLTLEAKDKYGEPCSFHCDGFEARAVQHELDHLDGILFVDRVVSRRNDLFVRKVYK